MKPAAQETWQVAPGKSPTQADVSAPRMEGSGQLPGSSVVVPVVEVTVIEVTVLEVAVREVADVV